MALSNRVYISASGDSFYDNNTNTLTAIGTGLVTVTAAYGNLKTESYYHSYVTPTDIVVKDKNGNKINRLELNKDDTVDLTFEAWYNGIELKANQEQFFVSLYGDIGEFEKGKLKITSNGGEGSLTVSAGNLKNEIPIVVNSVYPFTDIENHWACEQIIYVHNEGIVNGYEKDDGMAFMPLKNITREEFAVIVCKMLGADVDGVSECNKDFDDIDEISDWAKPYVFTMANKDIILGRQGTEDNVFFAPKVTLTRAEAMTILSRILNMQELSEEKFDDDSDIPEWASDAIYSMYESGFITGYPDNTIKPMSNVTRAEATTMIYNIISKSF